MIDFNTTIDGICSAPHIPRDISGTLSTIPRPGRPYDHLLLTLCPKYFPELSHTVIFDRPASERRVHETVDEGIAKLRWLADLYRNGARSACPSPPKGRNSWTPTN